MKIWIDGDACPKQIKDILFHAAIKRKIFISIVANHMVSMPPSPFITRVLVKPGFDVADNYIVKHLEKNDLVITSDIILADLVVEKKATALSPKGMLFSEKNIKQILSMRNLNESLRNNGLIQGGPSQLNAKDIQLFSNHLDKTITQFHRNST